MNTDPWVFGDRMIYSNCKQVVGTQKRATRMQSLTRGSVICFGSTIAGLFCIDTVFVVDSSRRWVPSQAKDLSVDDAFMACTVHPTKRIPGTSDAEFTLYRGATVDKPVEGMFSFVPAKLADEDDPRFTRPAIVSDFINPASKQSTWGSRRGLALANVRQTWEDVRDQVERAGLLLGVSLETPSCENANDRLTMARRAGC